MKCMILIKHIHPSDPCTFYIKNPLIPSHPSSSSECYFSTLVLGKLTCLNCRIADSANAKPPFILEQ
jgi:hypothetical protein